MSVEHATTSISCAGPLQAVVVAQAQAAMSTTTFIQAVAFDSNGHALNVQFAYNVTNATTGLTSTNTLSVPLLTLVPIPYLKVNHSNSVPCMRSRKCGHVTVNDITIS